ncbi:hypothetical protein NUV25_21275, partial [Burkholderia pseudomultivorans]
PAAITIPPQQAAHAALSQLGHVLTSHGHWRHGLMAAFLAVLPREIRNALLLKQALAMGEVELARSE